MGDDRQLFLGETDAVGRDGFRHGGLEDRIVKVDEFL